MGRQEFFQEENRGCLHLKEDQVDIQRKDTVFFIWSKEFGRTY